MCRTLSPLTTVIACLTLSAPLLFAADPATPPAWDTSAGLGANLSSGNSKTRNANARISTERKGSPNEFRFLLEGNYGEAEVTKDDGTTKMEKNVQNAHFLADYKYVPGGRNYAGLSLDLLQDDIAELDYRLTVGPSIGRYFVKTDQTSLNLEIGAAYINERLASNTDGRIAYRAFEQWAYMLSKTAKVWQSIEYLPTAKDLGEFLANAEIGVEAAMNTRISLRLVAQDKYNSDPAAGKDKNDLLVTAGVAVNL